MDLKSLIAKMDAIEKLDERWQDKNKLTLKAVQDAVINVGDEDQRRQVLAKLAADNGLPGLYDPISKEFVNNKGEVPMGGTGEKDMDTQLASLGLIPAGAKTSTGFGRFFGSTSKERDQQLAQTSDKYNKDRETGLSRDASIDKVEDLMGKLKAAHDKREADFQKKKGEKQTAPTGNAMQPPPANAGANAAPTQNPAPAPAPTPTASGAQQGASPAQSNPKVAQMQAELQKAGANLGPTGADGKIGKFTTAAMQQHPDIAKKYGMAPGAAQGANPAQTQQAPERAWYDPRGWVGLEEGVQPPIAKSLVESFGYELSEEMTPGQFGRAVNQLSGGAIDKAGGEVQRIAGKIWDKVVGSDAGGGVVKWARRDNPKIQKTAEQLKALADKSAEKDAAKTTAPAAAEKVPPKVEPAKIDAVVAKEPEAQSAWRKGYDSLVTWVKANPKKANAIGLLGLLGLGGLLGLAGGNDNPPPPPPPHPHPHDPHVDPHPVDDVQDEPSQEELDLAAQLRDAIEAMKKYDAEGKDREIQFPASQGTEMLKPYLDKLKPAGGNTAQQGGIPSEQQPPAPNQMPLPTIEESDELARWLKIARG